MSLTRTIFPITTQEKSMILANAALLAIGTTTGIFVEGLWFSTTSVEAGGLGLALTGAKAITAISAMGIFSALVAIPISWYFYKDSLSESQGLNSEISDGINNRKYYSDELFYSLLRLRSLYNTSIDFENKCKTLEYSNEINIEKLFILVNQIYRKFKNKTYSLQLYPQPVLHESKKEKVSSFSELLSHPSISKDLMSQIRLIHNPFDVKFSKCFKPILTSPAIKRKKAVAYGLIGGLSIAGVVLGTGWGFAALVVGAGLSAAIPVVGWAILGISSLIAGIVFGIGVGICKQKNLQREELKKKVSHSNQVLRSTISELHFLITQKNIIAQQAEKEKTNQKPLFTSSPTVRKGLNLFGLMKPPQVTSSFLNESKDKDDMIQKVNFN